MTTYSGYIKTFLHWGWDSVVEHLPSMNKTFDSIATTVKEKRKYFFVYIMPFALGGGIICFNFFFSIFYNRYVTVISNKGVKIWTSMKIKAHVVYLKFCQTDHLGLYKKYKTWINETMVPNENSSIKENTFSSQRAVS